MNAASASTQVRASTVLLSFGILSATIYVATDAASGMMYPGYSFSDQYVSELFAIGAPTSRLVVALFTVSSALLAAFAVGVWRSAGSHRSARLMALAMLGSALVGLVLWNFFPMHMRGAGRSFTDTMHLILATNPFVALSLAFAVAAFRNGFRRYTLATIVALVVPAIFAFRYAAQIDAGQATPGLGLAERIAQYAYQLWQVTLAVKLMRASRAWGIEQRPRRVPSTLMALSLASSGPDRTTVQPSRQWPQPSNPSLKISAPLSVTSSR